MSSTLLRRVATVGAAAVLTTTPLLVPTSAEAAALTCRASMSDATPKQYTNVFVRVKTAPRAKVRTVAHYKTTDTVRRGKANSKGRASIKYYISGATPGYRVRVDVKVTKNGKSKSCSTSFKPHR
jgi:hypothetical protein